MDNDSKQLYIQNIEEFLLDENKIITYMWLGERLCIHVNNAKTLLTDYVEYHKKKHSDIPIRLSYIAALLNKDGKVSMVVLDSEDKKLVEEKSYFQHIYSIQKTEKPIEHNSLYLLNKLNHFENCLGVLKNDLTEKRTDSDVVIQRQNSYQDAKDIVNECVSSVSKNNNVPVVAVKEKPPNSIQKNAKPNSISSMFANQTKKEKPAESKPEKKQNVQKNKGMADFIKKETNSTLETEKTLNFVKTEPKKDVTIKKESVKDCSDTKSDTKIAQKIKKEKEDEVPKKVFVSKDKAKVDKKRKRVMHISDSEESADEKDDVDEDPFKEEELPMSDCDDDIIESTPTGKIKINSNTLNPKKYRKVVDKTYADEDGYILTRKEEVMETCSDEEGIEDQNKASNINAAKVSTVKESAVKNKPVEKKSPPIKNKKKQITPKGKQSMLTNFFARKT